MTLEAETLEQAFPAMTLEAETPNQLTLQAKAPTQMMLETETATQNRTILRVLIGIAQTPQKVKILVLRMLEAEFLCTLARSGGSHLGLC